jgi:cyclopropane-fatty-acyl-phospholipid synthase
MAGEWESEDATALLELFAVNLDTVGEQTMASGLAERLLAVQHFLNRNTRTGARRNIAAHYDLGNAFYESWLDPTMTYSSAYFGRGANDLEAAQRDKYRRLAESTGIRPGERVLEIGCGWGGFAEYAAGELGCRVTGLTLSAEQKAYAEERLRRRGLDDRVEIALRDYRDERGTFDRIVSIEMFEAVGERYWPTFFRTVRERLAPHGRAGLQIITLRDDLFESYRKSADFIQKYIFPGGMLPPMDRLGAVVEGEGLATRAVEGFGRDYARTLAEWRERFLAAWPQLPAMGFDERFRRMWLFYLHFCEAGFRAGTIDVKHVVLERA